MSASSSGFVSRVRIWWSAGTEAQNQTRLGIAGLIVAVVALVVAVIALTPVWNDLTASPEEKLVKLGYRKTYEDFWRAVANKHAEAVGLFAKAGLRLEPRDFARLFDDRVFNAEVFDTLRKADAISAAHCPTDLKGLVLYRTVSSNPEKLAAIRKPCATASVVDAIRASRAAETARQSEQQAKSRERPARIAQCRAKYQAEGDDRLLADASQFYLLSATTYTERQCVLAQLNRELLVGTLRDANVRATVARSVQRCCRQYDPDVRVDESGLRAVDDALAVLRAT